MAFLLSTVGPWIGFESKQASAANIYWTDGVNLGIRRANLDGSDIETIINDNLNRPYGIALDAASEQMYWTDAESGKVSRANFDGTGRETLVDGLGNGAGPNGIALDVDQNRMYWIQGGDNKIVMASLDGSGMATVLELPGAEPESIALDLIRGQMYWTETSIGIRRVRRANLDGTAIETIVPNQSSVGSPQGLALDVLAEKLYWTQSRRIFQANLDGSDIQELFLASPDGFPNASPGEITLDLVGQKMYWTQAGRASANDLWEQSIRRANLDGTNVETIVSSLDTPLLHSPLGIAVHPVPEPSTLILTVLGLLGNIAHTWRSRLMAT